MGVLKQGAEDSAVGDGEGGAGEFVEGEFAVAGGGGEAFDFAFDFGEGHVLDVAENRDG